MFGSELAIPLLDLLIIVGYLSGILAVGILSVRKMKLTSQGYFLAGRSLRWGMVGAALFASNISTIHLVGLAASGYNEGLVWGNFEWMATFTLILLGLVFAPFYFKSRISTLPEFLERRYSRGSRIILAFMAIMAALFIHIGMSLYAGAAVFKQFFGIDVITSIFIISVETAIYTVLGGLKAVVVTETIQTILDLIKKGDLQVLLLRRECALEAGKRERARPRVYVDQDRCSGDACGCARFCSRVFSCPANIWDHEAGKAGIDEVLCAGCGVCASLCPERAIVVESETEEDKPGA